MEIRDYQIEDETSWVRCRVLSFLDTAYYDIVAREKERYQHPSIELVAVENGVVIGLLDIECEEEPNAICTAHETLGAMIWHLAVHPDYRRQKIATTLLNEAQKILKDQIEEGCLVIPDCVEFIGIEACVLSIQFCCKFIGLFDCFFCFPRKPDNIISIDLQTCFFD